MMKDGYKVIFERLGIDENQFIKIGIDEIIFIEYQKAEKEWNAIKEKIKNKEKLFIRSYGRNGINSELYLDLYKEIFNHKNIEIDQTNNNAPKKKIESLTNLKRNKDISNYQISHVFGLTKNPYCFTAPWNIVYIPKIMDPFTGHESKGELTKKFTKMFREKIFYYYKKLIEDYNSIARNSDYNGKIDNYCKKINKAGKYNNKTIERFKKDAKQQFKKIEI